MTELLSPAFWVVTLLSGLLYVVTSRWLLAAISDDSVRPSSWWVVFGFCELAFFLAAAVFGIPLPLFCLLLYGLKTIELMSISGSRRQSWLSINLSFLFTATLYLIVLGFFSLVSGLSTVSILHDPVMRTASLCVMLLLDAGVMRLSSRQRAYLAIYQKGYSSEESALFVEFTFLSVAFVLVDSIACLFDLPPFMVSLFLIGSNLLLLLMIDFFLNQLDIIKQEVYLETEHDQLEADRLAQLQRTETLRDTAYRDLLTGAYSRLYALERLSELLESGSPFSLVYIDLDGLKGINDAYGHLAGDHYLKDFVSLFTAFLDSGDIFARMGGDEFILLVPGGAADTVKEKLTVFRQHLEADNGRQPGMPLSFSFGVTGTTGQTGESSDDLIQKADRAMYQDKAAQHRKRGLPT